MPESPLFDAPKLKHGSLIFRAFNNKVRQKILLLLHRNARMTVTSVFQKTGLEQPAASQHLAILRRANLVSTEKEGTKIFYSVHYQQLKLLHTVVEMLQEKRASEKT